MLGSSTNKIDNTKEKNLDINEAENSNPISDVNSVIQFHPNPHPTPLKTWEITKDIATDIKEKVFVGMESVFDTTKDLMLGHEETKDEVSKTAPHGIIQDNYNKRIIE